MPTHKFAPITQTVLSLSSMRGIDKNAMKGDIGFIIGLLERSRRLLRALLFLFESDYGDCSESLCRSILEHCATGIWLLEDIDNRFEIVLRAALRDLRIRKELGSEKASKSYQEISSLINSRWGDGSREAKLPSINQRLIGPLAQRETIYRELCGRLHSSIYSAAMGLMTVSDSGEMIYQRNIDFEAGYLPFATILVWGLAIILSDRLQLSVKEQLADIAGVFENYCKIKEQGHWSLI
jgi:hypothetical protein